MQSPCLTGRLVCGVHRDVPLLPTLTRNLNFFHNLVGGVVDVDGHIDGVSMVVDLWWEKAQLYNWASQSPSLGTQVVARARGQPLY